MSIAQEISDEVDEFADENERLRDRIRYLQSAMRSLCALMEADIECQKVTGTETRLRVLIEARSLL